ncbi:MAG: hypothetical protein WAV48_04545 [Candidatus Magasanikiibacteriota bacterium]
MNNIEQIVAKYQAQWFEEKEIHSIKELLEKAITEATTIDVEKMVDRFLQWELPKDFKPDCGISFDSQNGQLKPIGTNLFTATQAKKMIENILTEATSAKNCERVSGSDSETF